jgi:spore germination protein KB
MKKTKISDHQFFALTVNFTIGTIIITISSSIATLAQQDAWISAIIAPVIGVPFIWLYYYLGKLFPGKTLIDMVNYAFGKWVGWILSAMFVLFVCFLNVDEVMFYMGNFIQSEYMSETPLYALNILLAVAIVIGALYGFEAIARSAEIFFILIVVLISFTMILAVKDIKPENLLPIFEKGIAPSLKGSLSLSCYMTWPIVIFLMIHPLSTDNTIKTRNSFIYGYLLGALFNFICIIMSVMVLGSTITAGSEYPTYLMAKGISIGILTRIEGIVALSWILSQFIRLILYFYTGLIGFCQLFNIKNHKRIILPLGLVVLAYSGVIYPTAAYQTKWDTTTWIPFISTFGAVLPLLVLIISKIKMRNMTPDQLKR